MVNDLHLSGKVFSGFLRDLFKNGNGVAEHDEVEQKSDEIHQEVAPESRTSDWHNADLDDAQRHAFLRSVAGTDKSQVPRDDFVATVRERKISSSESDKKTKEERED
ncbi:unnamed protein product [Diplocarpon coronariae]|uniref:Uncharacterized protein n=1 Tax=Diplocarpon coronariae TaxID=2795749 RepID=A0A218Z8Z8_9HELO|nr:hypothetical protein B2J93_2188 [Marssonina coronariae]